MTNPSRVTLWRHQSGRSKTTCPKGEINYTALATAMVKRNFKALWYEYRADAVQEIELLVLEVQRANLWAQNSKGKNQGCVGSRRFLRWIWRHFNAVSKNYGLRRTNGTGTYKIKEVSLDENIYH